MEERSIAFLMTNRAQLTQLSLGILNLKLGVALSWMTPPEHLPDIGLFELHDVILGSPAHRPGSFGKRRLLSVFDRFGITNAYLKPHNQPIFEKNPQWPKSALFAPWG